MRKLPLLAWMFISSVLVSALSLDAAPLPRSAPEAEGVPSTAIARFVAAADQQVDAMHSVMLVRHGRVIAEGWWTPFAAAEPHVLFSLSKSFTSTAVGLAVAEGRLSIDDPVLKFFPEDAPAEPGENLRAMRVRDLLTMSTGQHGDAIGDFPFMAKENLVKRFLALPVAHKPGTHFVYNTPATFMQSAIVQKVTGQTVLEYLRTRLFGPLGIEQPQWDASADGITLGGFGLSVRTEDIAKFGQLYLQNGSWNGRQLVPAGWVAQATARQVSNGSDPASDWEQGYGFQFWRCRHGFYRGDGAFGQFCIVMPQHDMVVAITSGTKDMGRVMQLVWDLLVPALAAEPLPENAAGHAALQRQLGGLALPVQTGQPTAPAAAGVAGRRFGFEPNPLALEAVTLEPAKDGGVTLVFKLAGLEQRLVAGHGGWVKGEMTTQLGTDAMATSGAWTADDTYTAKVVRYRTPFTTTFQLRFAEGQLLLDAEQNVGFGPTKLPTLVGKPL